MQDTFSWQDSVDGFSLVTHNATNRKIKMRGAIAPWNLNLPTFDRMWRELQSFPETKRISQWDNTIEKVN